MSAKIGPKLFKGPETLDASSQLHAVVSEDPSTVATTSALAGSAFPTIASVLEAMPIFGDIFFSQRSSETESERRAVAASSATFGSATAADEPPTGASAMASTAAGALPSAEILSTDPIEKQLSEIWEGCLKLIVSYQPPLTAIAAPKQTVDVKSKEKATDVAESFSLKLARVMFYLLHMQGLNALWEIHQHEIKTDKAKIEAEIPKIVAALKKMLILVPQTTSLSLGLWPREIKIVEEGMKMMSAPLLRVNTLADPLSNAKIRKDDFKKDLLFPDQVKRILAMEKYVLELEASGSTYEKKLGRQFLSFALMFLKQLEIIYTHIDEQLNPVPDATWTSQLGRIRALQSKHKEADQIGSLKLVEDLSKTSLPWQKALVLLACNSLLEDLSASLFKIWNSKDEMKLQIGLIKSTVVPQIAEVVSDGLRSQLLRRELWYTLHYQFGLTAPTTPYDLYRPENLYFEKKTDLKQFLAHARNLCAKMADDKTTTKIVPFVGSPFDLILGSIVSKAKTKEVVIAEIRADLARLKALSENKSPAKKAPAASVASSETALVSSSEVIVNAALGPSGVLRLSSEALAARKRLMSLPKGLPAHQLPIVDVLDKMRIVPTMDAWEIAQWGGYVRTHLVLIPTSAK